MIYLKILKDNTVSSSPFDVVCVFPVVSLSVEVKAVENHY